MQKGDFVKIEFTGRVEPTGEIFDLTDEELAKKEGIHNPKHRYGPVLVVVGEGMVVPGVDKELEKMKPGEEKEFSLGPKEAFGQRNVKLIKIVSMSNFIKQNINPTPGTFVNINGRQAKVQSVSGGRVRVDFNHPLANREVKYKVRITEEIRDPLKKAMELMDYYGIKADVSLEGTKAGVKTETPMPDVVKKLMESKLKEWVKEIKSVEFSSDKKKESENQGNQNQADKPSPESHTEGKE